MGTRETKIENAAIAYANTQPNDQWNAAKLGYLAGALDARDAIKSRKIENYKRNKSDGDNKL